MAKKTTTTEASAKKPCAKKACAPKAAAEKAPVAKKAPAKKAAEKAEPTAAPAKKCCKKACAAEAAPAKKAPAKKPAAPKKAKVTFSVNAELGSKVYVAGTFNNWDPTANELIDKKGTGEYAGTIALAKGKYEYKFIINGAWIADPDCHEWVGNDQGTINSCLTVE